MPRFLYTLRRDCGRFLLVAVVALGAAGCTYQHPYPAAWPALPVATNADCRQAPIRIENVGVHARAGRASFYDALFGANVHQARNGHVWIERTDERVRVTYIEPTSAGWEVRQVRDVTDFGCEEGRLVLQDTHLVAGPGAAAVSGITLKLAVAPRYVMVEQVERAAGIAMIVPVAAEANDWMWFGRVE